MKRQMVGSLVATVSLVGLLAGCGQNSSGGNSAPTNANGSSASGDNLSGTFEIQYFVGGYGDTWWKAAIAAFQKQHPNLHIIQDAGPKVNQQMQPRWASNNPPDVVYIDGNGANETQMVQDHQLMDITNWIQTAKNDNGDAIENNLIEQPQSYADGKVYSIPLVFGYNATWWNQTLFTQKNWPAPTSWDTFLSDMDKARADGMYGYIHQGIYPAYIEQGLLFPLFASEGGNQVLQDIQNMKPGVFLSAPVQDGMKKVQMLRDKGYIDKGALALNHIQSQMEWLQGKAAFIPDGLWVPNEMAKDIPQGWQFGLVPSPFKNSNGKFEVYPYVSTMAVAAHAKNPEAAKAFIQFIFSKQWATEWVKDTGALMNYKVDLSNVSGIPDYVKTASSYLTGTDVDVLTPLHISADLQKALDDNTTAFLAGQIDAQQWGQKMEDAAKRIQAQNNG